MVKKVNFTEPVNIVQDGLPAVVMFALASTIEDKGETLLIDGNEVPVGLIKNVEWEAA